MRQPEWPRHRYRHLDARHALPENPGTRETAVAVAGLEAEGAATFARSILGDREELDVDQARAEHRAAARRLVAAHPEIGAIVLECANMPPYRADVQAATGLPVFDITDLVRLVHAGLGADFPGKQSATVAPRLPDDAQPRKRRRFFR